MFKVQKAAMQQGQQAEIVGDDTVHAERRADEGGAAGEWHQISLWQVAVKAGRL